MRRIFIDSRDRRPSLLSFSTLRLPILIALLASSTGFCDSLVPTTSVLSRPLATLVPPTRHSAMPFLKLSRQAPDDVEAGEQTQLLPSKTNIDDPTAQKRSVSKEYGSTGEAVLDLAIPALGALLIDPIMTLIDTAFVGRFSDTPDALAGMGSAAALLTFSFYLFGFLTKVTTPLVSSKRAAGNEAGAVAIGGQALSLALGMGCMLTLVLLAFQDNLLGIMGAVNAGPETLGYAKDFLIVRTFAAPAVLCISASTGILRGYLDTKTPIVILVAANLINFALDVVLIVFGHMGPMGAAIATTSAEWIGALLFLFVLAGRLPSAAGELGSNHKDSNAAKALQGDSLAILPSFSIPPWEEIEPLVTASSSVFMRSLVLQAALSSAAALAARNGDADAAASLGAHQIGIQLWLLCSFISDALAAASQGLVADALGRDSKSDAREVAKTVFGYSLGLGLTLGSLLYIGSASNFLFTIFTQDASIQQELGRILPLIIFSQPLNSYVFAADGVIEGAAEFTFQAQSMFVSVAAALAVYMSLMGMDYSNGDTLVQVWTALIVLQLFRGITASWKIAQKAGPIDILTAGTSSTESR
ncbi:Protein DETOXIFICATION [Seminavis robusta]|uniref:Protein DETOXIFICATION n=1 Tax=Seminavis robusta TaxID=568900 RepID=A0A9N8DAH5_9STRA|nr:Protein DETOXIFICATION [Seminavis robusta]|eukprot:Sro65_g036730.1 Protein DETOXIFICATION (587) ;mRNA; f:60433-62193